jgi:hypothetical protein
VTASHTRTARRRGPARCPGHRPAAGRSVCGDMRKKAWTASGITGHHPCGCGAVSSAVFGQPAQAGALHVRALARGSRSGSRAFQPSMAAQRPRVADRCVAHWSGRPQAAAGPANVQRPTDAATALDQALATMTSLGARGEQARIHVLLAGAARLLGDRARERSHLGRHGRALYAADAGRCRSPRSRGQSRAELAVTRPRVPRSRRSMSHRQYVLRQQRDRRCQLHRRAPARDHQRHRQEGRRVRPPVRLPRRGLSARRLTRGRRPPSTDMAPIRA